MSLNTSYKHHVILGLVMAIWLSSVLILIAPFDTSDLSFMLRLRLLPVYGMIALTSYMVLIPIQNWIVRKWLTWSIILEISLIALFSINTLFLSFAYYKTSFINGTYSFGVFTTQVYFPILLILLPILIFLRWYVNTKLTKEENKEDTAVHKIVLKGDNRLDILQLELKEIVCISSAENYIEVNYLLDGVLQKKLLRTTLKKVHAEIPELVKTHRSYLVNPAHIKEWKNANTLTLTQKEVPVSKSYKNSLLSMQGK